MLQAQKMPNKRETIQLHKISANKQLNFLINGSLSVTCADPKTMQIDCRTINQKRRNSGACFL